jgi:hypothetical protein
VGWTVARLSARALRLLPPRVCSDLGAHRLRIRRRGRR